MAWNIGNGGGGASTALDFGADGAIHVPSADFLYSASFVRSGSDLKLVGDDGHTILVPRYFDSGTPPPLIAPNDTVLNGDTVRLLAGPAHPGQYAQAGDAAAAPSPIGKVVQADGTINIQHADGTAGTLHLGDAIFENDVVETGASSVGIRFTDGSLFSMSAGTRMVINHFVYDADSSSNSALFSVIKGTFTMFGGKVVDSGHMEVSTPIATLGIRGSNSIGVNVDAPKGWLTTNATDPNGDLSKVEVLDPITKQAITTLTDLFSKVVITPAGVQIVATTPQEIADAQKLAQILQHIYGIRPPSAPHFDEPTVKKIFFDFDDHNFNVLVPGSVLFIPYQALPALHEELRNGILQAAESPPVNVAPVNDPPVAVADTLAATEGTPVTYTAAQLLGNDTDVDNTNGQLSIASVTNGTGGTVVLNPTTGTVTFTPNADFNGAANFSYTVSDGTATSAPATVTVNVAPVNDPPVAVADTLAATEGTPVTYTAAQLLGNDTDVDNTNGQLSIASVTNGTGGTVVLNPTTGTVTFTPNADFNGAANFSYTVSDGTATSAPATVTVNVAPVNDPPVAVADTLAATEGTPVTYTAAQLLGNDTDVDNTNGQLSIASVTNGTGGTVVLNPTTGTVTFTPNADFNGAANFSYTVSDGTATSAPATVTVNVAPVNDPPVAVADTLAATEGTPVTYTAAQLLGNDTDVDNTNGQLSIASVTNGTGGTVVLNPTTGTVTFTPNADFNGAANFSYTVSDGTATSAPATVTVNVAPVNDPPVAVADTLAATEGTPVTYTAAQLLGNDTDVDNTNGQLSIASVTNGTGGTVVLNPTTGTVTFTPNADFNGAANFSYTVSDGTATSAPATVTVNVAPVNDPPVAVADTLAATEGTPVTYTAAQLLGNDTDVDNTNGQLSIASVTNGTGGTVVLNPTTGTVTFTPNADFNGAANFSYTVSDGTATSAPATVTVNVAPVNDPPVAVADTLAATEGTPVTYTAAQLLGNDTDVDNTNGQLSIASVTNGTGGTVVLNPTTGTVTFTPNADFNGAANFSYTVSDGTATSAPATVTVNVAPVNDPPVAVADTLAATEGTPVTYTAAQLLGNDTDVDNTNGQLSIASVTNGTGGTVVLNPTTGTVTFTPNADFNGAANFSYTVSDGTATSAPATVTVNVAPVNDPPVAVADTLAATEGTPVTYTAAQLLGNDTDVDNTNGQLSIASVTNGTGGTVVLNPTTGTVTFTPNADFNGAANFSYTVSDGTATSAPATVTVNVAPVNDPPVAVADTLAATEGTPVTYTAAQLLGNDTDVDNTNGQLSIASVTNGTGGTVVLNPTTGTVTFTPNADFNGAANFSYTVSDGTATSAPATVTVNVAPEETTTLYLKVLQDSWQGASDWPHFDNFKIIVDGVTYTLGTSPELTVVSSNFYSQSGDDFTLGVGTGSGGIDRYVVLAIEGVPASTSPSSVEIAFDYSVNPIQGATNLDGIKFLIGTNETTQNTLVYDGDRDPAFTGNPDNLIASPRQLSFDYSFSGDVLTIANQYLTFAADPLVLDLGAPGVSFTSFIAGVHFDINADGILDQVAWTSGDDGILAYDLDGSGKIENGAELFTPQFVGGHYADGLAALASLDSNSDGVIDAQDAAFANLSVWIDANHDGVSDAGELESLAALGITGIDLGAAGSNAFINGQAILAEGSFIYADGSTGTFVEVDFDASLGNAEAANDDEYDDGLDAEHEADNRATATNAAALAASAGFGVATAAASAAAADPLHLDDAGAAVPSDDSGANAAASGLPETGPDGDAPVVDPLHGTPGDETTSDSGSTGSDPAPTQSLAPVDSDATPSPIESLTAAPADSDEHPATITTPDGQPAHPEAASAADHQSPPSSGASFEESKAAPLPEVKGLVDHDTPPVTANGGSASVPAVSLAERLTALDTNHDGLVDANDANFSKLTVWQDANHDGVADADELSSLADHGIDGISLNGVSIEGYLDAQSLLAQTASGEPLIAVQGSDAQFAKLASLDIGDLLLGGERYIDLDQALKDSPLTSSQSDGASANGSAPSEAQPGASSAEAAQQQADAPPPSVDSGAAQGSSGTPAQQTPSQSQAAQANDGPAEAAGPNHADAAAVTIHVDDGAEQAQNHAVA